MYDCECLIHPFQNDPGTSQSQRVMDELLSDAAKIDARTLADLLDYFVQLSRHINFYDARLNVSDWQPFFKNSIPFVLASVIKNQQGEIENNFAYYNSLFEKKPSASGLQLQAYFIFYRFINKINNWHIAVKDSRLPIENFLEILIKDKLQQPVKFFIGYTNAAVKFYGIKRIDFSKLFDNKVWNLELADLYTIDNSFKTGTASKFKQLNNLYRQFTGIVSPFLDSIKIISAEAENNLEQSLLPLKDELQKKHPPHLGLLFAFLNIFRYLQNDLNGYTRKHLDFFYKDVLQIKSRDAIADKAHVIFEIQKQLEKYLIKKGILVKDGKDNNKQEILFSLDDEIVVNKTEVADTKTLFLNNQSAFEQSYVEGVYIANDATKADGIDKDFKDDQPKNFSTLGATLSKYSDPETKIIKPYANGRLGFILGSPVLYLKEGTRTIEINLDCYLDETLCNEIAFASGGSKDCCTESGESGVAGDNNTYPNFYQVHNFFTEVSTSLSSTYYYFNQDTLKQAIKKGIKSELVERLRENFLLIKNTNFDPGKPLDYCTNCPAPKYRYEGLLNENQYFAAFSNEKEILAEWIKPVKPLSILFSGEKDWIEPVVGKPGDPANLFISPGILSFTNNKFRFTLTIKAVLTPDKPAVTFYDKNNLKEDFDTTQPVVKIELDDRIKLIDLPLKSKASQQGTDEGCCVQSEDCCLLKTEEEDLHVVSLYHFFRNVLIDINTPPAEVIKVAVCGLKNFIVQNDESLQDVNGPVYPFGVRPVIDANFYIGSPEIFSKNWQNIQINHNWKDKPAISFEEYYTAYQHMFIDPNDINNKTIEGIIKDNNYKASIAILDDGTWYDDGIITCDETGVNDDNLLFRLINEGPDLCLDTALIFAFAYKLARSDFATLPLNKKGINCTSIKKLNADTRSCFLRITLKCQNFQHDRYAFILSRQMMAFGRLPADLLAGAYYRVNPANAIIVFNSVGALAGDLDLDITTLQTNAGNTKTQTAQTITEAHGAGGTGAGSPVDLEAHQADSAAQTTVGSAQDVRDSFDELTLNIPFLPFLTPSNRTKLEAVIPNEPWTPIISNMSLDYTASATLEDIDLIHLYPYAGTYKHEEIELQPNLFPTFCDEGTLFLGLKNLIPGNNLNMLFELAEATSDSESEKEEVQWHYLDSNVWKPLSKGFEVLDDASENLTTSGIVKFAMPANMTKDNTIMPKDLHWIKASIAQNSKAVSETTGIHPHAIRVTFTNDEANDKLRLSNPLAAGSISKLKVADANVKSVQQPYDTFDGSIPEIEQQFYVRVSELLRHKGRAIQKFDYERLTLEAFPQLFKAKCINHSFALDAHLYKNDFPYAPGYIILAVIPDLYKLKAGNSFEPKVPVSIIEKIETYIRKRTSPFVRFRAMNPRYEKINFCLRVKLIQGKDENYYREKLKLDMKELLAPWAVGKYDKLTFGQCVFRSDIIRFLESTDYVDFINDFRMGKEGADPDDKVSKIYPDTPRSILIAGNIEVCIDQPECEEWKFCSQDNNNQIKIDCCTTPLIPVADYCIDKNEMIG